MDRFRLHQDSTVNLSDFESSNLHDASTAHDYGGEVKITGKSIKEVEEQLNFLRKENFDLKLRIFFLEENIKPGFDIQETVKANVNLNLEVESLKNKLDMSQKEKDEHNKNKREMEKKLSDLEKKLNNKGDIEELKSIIAKQADQIKEYENDVGYFLKKVEEYSAIISKQTAKLEKYETDEKLCTLEKEELEKYEMELKDKEEKIKKLEANEKNNKIVISKLETNEKETACKLEKWRMELQDREFTISKLEKDSVCKLEMYKLELKDREDTISKLEKETACKCETYMMELKEREDTISKLKKETACECKTYKMELKEREDTISKLKKETACECKTYKMELKEREDTISKLEMELAKYKLEIKGKDEKLSNQNRALKNEVIGKYEREITEKDQKILNLESMLRNNLSDASLNSLQRSPNSMRRSPLKSLSPPNVSDAQKLEKLESERSKACKVIQTLVETKKKDRAEIEELKKKLKAKNEEVEKFRRLTEIGNTSRSIRQNINESNCEDMKLLEQYKELTEELDTQKEILMETIKEKDAQMLKLEQNYSSVLTDLKSRESRIKELESEILDKENRENSDSNKERNIARLKSVRDEYLNYKREKELELKKKCDYTEELKRKLTESDENLRKSETLRAETNEICMSLSAHLEELALFLDSLLRQKSILGFLGNNRNNRLKQIVNNSLNLSKSLNLSLTMNPDQSLLQLTNISELLNSIRVDSMHCFEDEGASRMNCSRDARILEEREHVDPANGNLLETNESNSTQVNLNQSLNQKSFLIKSTQLMEKSPLYKSTQLMEKSPLYKSTQSQHNENSSSYKSAQSQHLNEKSSSEFDTAEFSHEHNLNHELNLKEKELHTLRDLNVDLIAKFNSLMAKYDEEVHLHTEFEAKLANAEREKIISDEKIETLEQQISVLGDLVDELEQNKCKLSDTLEENLKVIQSLECELSETLEGKEIVEEELMLAQERVRLAEGKLDDYEVKVLELEKAKKAAEEEFVKIKLIHQEEIHTMISKVESLQEIEINLNRQLEESERDYLETITDLRKELDEAVTHYTEILNEKNRVANLNTQLENRLSVLFEREAEMANEITDLKKKCQNLNESNNPTSLLQLNYSNNVNSDELRENLEKSDVNLPELKSPHVEVEKDCCEENTRLKKRLDRSERLLRESLKKIKFISERERELEKNICSQLNKTNQVLQEAKVRLNFEPQQDKK